MNKYINAEELTEELEKQREFKDNEYCKGINAMLDTALMIIHNLTLGEEKTSMPPTSDSNIMKYINADEYVSKLQTLYPQDTDDDFDAGVLDGIAQAEELIAEMPSSDFLKVRHGKWAIGVDYAECSICGFKFDTVNNITWWLTNGYNFCPNCGADMRGEENEN